MKDLSSSLTGLQPLALTLAITLVLAIPLLLHFIIFRSSSSTTLPSFLLLGPSGSGKTSLLILFEQGQHRATRTSQAPLSAEVSLPVTTVTASSKYRSANDPTNQAHKKFLLVDTPGHGKLRHYAFDSVVKPRNLKGIIFMIDAAEISEGSLASGNEPLRQAAEYLHDVLLLLQRRSLTAKSSDILKGLPVLIAVNKLDLFTALPAPLVKSALESEISKIRSSRSKGLLDSGIGMSESGVGEEKDWLGDEGESRFEFSQMEGTGVLVSIEGGNVTGTDGSDVKMWWSWIGSNL